MDLANHSLSYYKINVKWRNDEIKEFKYPNVRGVALFKRHIDTVAFFLTVNKH